MPERFPAGQHAAQVGAARQGQANDQQDAQPQAHGPRLEKVHVEAALGVHDVEVMLGKFETMVSERNPLREDVKALAKLKALRPEDRKRLRTAAVAVSDWYSSWVAAQFAPLPTAKAELKEMAKKEKSKRKKETE